MPRGGSVKVSWVPGAISWPAYCAAAGYQISQGNRRLRTVSSAWIVRTPTGNRPRANGSYSSVQEVAPGVEGGFVWLLFPPVIEATSQFTFLAEKTLSAIILPLIGSFLLLSVISAPGRGYWNMASFTQQHLLPCCFDLPYPPLLSNELLREVIYELRNRSEERR